MTSESSASPCPEEATPPLPSSPGSMLPPPLDPPPLAATDTTAAPLTVPEAAPADSVPPPLASNPAGTEQPRASHPFVFHGDAREYFRIWIVNTLLTLLTVGLYSAWAKVRKRRYLRGNTELMGHRFDYRADPKRILTGNILVAVLFLAYMVVGQVYRSVQLGAVLVGLVLLPWVVIRSLAFNAHNTAYRGMRFYSRQTYGWAAMTYIGQWVIIILTAGIYYPAWVRNRKKFTITSHRLGDAFFGFESKSGPFYGAYLISFAMILGAAVLGSFATGLMVLANGGKVGGALQLVPFFLVYGFALFCSKHYIYARLFNHVWNHTTLDRHRFSASLSASEWFKLQFVNLGALIVSCGLLYPWATVRSTRYALSCLRFEPAGPVENISRLSRSSGSAMGETAAEFVGLDIGL